MTSWEGEPLKRLAASGELMAFEHTGVLAADGHVARQEPPRGTLARWQCTVEVVEMNRDFWRGKRVFVTGHTGFSGCLAELVATASRGRQ
mgnify:CR=1 FL=1